MKKNEWLINFLLVSIFILAITITCFAQENEMPITSKSKEAIELFKEGRTLTENFQSLKATEKFDKAITLDPNFALAYLYKSMIAGDINQRSENMEKAKGLINNVSEGEKFFILYSSASYEFNDKDVKENLNQLLLLYPNDKYINVLAGTFYYGNREFDKAIKYYEKSLKIDKKYASAINMLTYSYKEMGQYDKAEQYAQKYIDLLPENGGPYDSYADLLLATDKLDESIKYYNLAYNKDKSMYLSLSRIGNIYIFKRDYAKARDYFNQYSNATDNMSDKFFALYQIASTYLYENNKEKALETLDDYKKLAVKNDITYNELFGLALQGWIESCCGNPDLGLEKYDQVEKRIETSNLSEIQKDRLKVYTSLWKYHAFIEMDNKEKSENAKMQCEGLASKLDNIAIKNNIELYNSYAYIRNKKYDLAISNLEKIDSKQPLYYYYYALAYDLKGDKDKAAKYYQELMKIKESDLVLAMFYKKAEKKLAE